MESPLARADIAETGRVLDIGCGVAAIAIDLVHRQGPEVTAVDISPMMLARASANVRGVYGEGRMTLAGGTFSTSRPSWAPPCWCGRAPARALAEPAPTALRDIRTAMAAVTGLIAGQLDLVSLPRLAADPLAALVGASGTRIRR